jgi:hypothetical protein
LQKLKKLLEFLMGISINSFYSSMPPKSPEGGLIGRVISIIKPTPYKSPFGIRPAQLEGRKAVRGQTRKGCLPEEAR